MNQLQTQNRAYWVSDFAITDSDVEQIYNHFLEVERPQSAEEIGQVILAHRVAEERNQINRQMTGRTVYQPKDEYEVGDELVFPALNFAQGKVKSIREGFDPQYGQYNVIAVDINSRSKEFASSLPGEHKLNMDSAEQFDPFEEVNLEELSELYGSIVTQKVAEGLAEREEFVRLGDRWFVRGLMAEVNVGHLHLAEAVLEVSQGGPLTIEDIVIHLDMDDSLDPEVQRFSLNHALSEDERFDEVGPSGKIAWFLQRLEPEQVQSVPERLQYRPIEYDRNVLSPQLLLLERELDDEWSDLEPAAVAQPTILSLTYPHRWAGTLPLGSRVRPLFPTGTSDRQLVTLVDEQEDVEIRAWLVPGERYVFGLTDWYEENNIPVGGFITLKPGPEQGVVMIDYDRRRPQREWVRLANVIDNRIEFELERRSVGCGYDDLLIVGTDYVAALDAMARRIEANNWSLSTLLVNIVPGLAKLNPQEAVHSKTIYSAANMLWRVPPGPLFAELIEEPAFIPVGDHYWEYDGSKRR